MNKELLITSFKKHLDRTTELHSFAGGLTTYPGRIESLSHEAYRLGASATKVEKHVNRDDWSRSLKIPSTLDFHFNLTHRVERKWFRTTESYQLNLSLHCGTLSYTENISALEFGALKAHFLQAQEKLVTLIIA